MKLSINFVKDYVDVDVDLKQLAEDMTRVGNEYDSAEKLINATKLVIGEIVDCKPHPDSDHLNLCKVNVGNEILNIVCGAPNARTGLKVIVALDGAELPGGTIKRGMIRGQESNGMICSIAELGLESKFLKPEDKEGIHELPLEAPIGEDPIKYMLMDDGVIDFDLTANRGDLLSILGMAYEIGAIYGKEVKEIDLTHGESGEDINNSFKADVQTDNCSVLLIKKVENVEIKESPEFIKNRLMASGIRSINNVVDISNYVMLELGQPLHFYNADGLKDRLQVRMAEEGEKLTTLDGNERTLTEEDIVISDGEKAIGLAGVMGGLETEVESTTKNVIIESAIFDSVKIRKTSNKILRSEASNRFEKGLDPNRTYMAVERAAKLLEKYAGGTVVTGTVVYDKTNKEEKKIDITFEDINHLLGMVIDDNDILDCFKRLNFKYEVKDRIITVTVPTRRIDIDIKEDLIEEVGRIYGVDNIKGKMPDLGMKAGHLDRTQRELRSRMIALGFNETLSYILVNEKEGKRYTNKKYDEVKLLDPITEERSVLRQSVISSLMKIYEYNKARNIKDVALFELGKTFGIKDEKYIEELKLAALIKGEYSTGMENKYNADFYVMKGVAEEVLDYLGYENRYSFIEPKEKLEDMHPGQTAQISVNNDIVGMIGRVHPQLQKDDVYVMEINLDRLLAKRVGSMKFKEISKYPTVTKDLAMIVDKNISAKQIEMEIKKAAGSLLLNSKVFDVYEGKNIEAGKRSIAFTLEFGLKDRTLVDEEINIILEKIIERLQKQINAELRK